MNSLKNEIRDLIDWHVGTVNIAMHIAGSAGLYRSVRRKDWRLFAASVLTLELGHVYNYVTGLRPYDVRPRILAGRAAAFTGLVAGMYLISRGPEAHHEGDLALVKRQELRASKPTAAAV